MTTVPNTTMPTCLIVADDALVRAGLRGLLDRAVIDCGCRQPADHRPDHHHDLVVVNLEPGTPAEELTHHLAGPAPVIVTSDRHDGDFVLDVLAAGAACFVARVDLGPIELALSVKEALNRRRHVSPAGAASLLASLRATPGTPPPGAGQDLSPRELEVMALVGDGAEDRYVAAALGISVKTVQNHLQTIYVKHDIHTRGEVVAWWQGRLERSPTGWATHRDNDP